MPILSLSIGVMLSYRQLRFKCLNSHSVSMFVEKAKKRLTE